MKLRLLSRPLPLLLVFSLAAFMACSQPTNETAETSEARQLSTESDESDSSPVPSGPAFETLAEGWNTITPGGDTTCSDGSAYHFYVRPGDPQRVLFYLQGGGACWNALTCDPDLQPSYRINLAGFDLSSRRGIFEFEHPENPFSEYTVVLAPYCTGDVHLGDRVATYESPAMEDHEAHSVTIRYRGLDNVQAPLNWTIANVESPATVFVTGSSAGSIPSPYYAMRLAEIYPEARVVQLGDGSGGYRDFGGVPPHVEWGTLPALAHIPDFRNMSAEDLDFEALFAVANAHQSDITFSQYDTAEDDVQKRFLALAESETSSLLELLRANQADIRAEVPGFRSFIAGGELHTILLRPEFYTYHVGGTRVRDWVKDLAIGTAVEDVHCVDCSAPEVLQ